MATLRKEIPIETVSKFIKIITNLINNLENKSSANFININKIIKLIQLAIKNTPDDVYHNTGETLVEQHELVNDEDISGNIEVMQKILSGSKTLNEYVNLVDFNIELRMFYDKLTEKEIKNIQLNFKQLLKIYILSIQ